VLGDDASIATLRSKLDTAAVNTEVVASVSLDESESRVDAAAFRTLVREHQVQRVVLATVSTDA
jgi:hypothetical protein